MNASISFLDLGCPKTLRGLEDMKVKQLLARHENEEL
jgi:hypothetical protein